MSKEEKVSPNDMEKMEKIETAKLTLKMMGLKPEDLVTLPAISLELKLQLDYDPQQENPVKVELIQVESVTDKSRQSKLTINNIREFIKNETDGALQEVVTERYFGYRDTIYSRRYVILIEERSDNKVAISIDTKKIQKWKSLRFIEVETIENDDYSTYSHWIYVYPTPEDEMKFLNFLKEYELDYFFNNYQGIIFSPYEYEIYQSSNLEDNDDTWYKKYKNIIGFDIPKELMDKLAKTNSLSISSENTRFSYMLTWLIPIEHCQSFLHDFIHYSLLHSDTQF
jgi:hypothetical protein